MKDRSRIAAEPAEPAPCRGSEERVATRGGAVDNTQSLVRRALLFDHMSEGVIITDLNARIVEWNPGAERLFGYTQREMVGRRVNRLYRTEDPLRLEEAILAELEKRSGWVGELRFVRKSGESGWCQTTIVPLRDDHGGRVANVCLNRDITRRWEAEEAARRHREELAHVLRVRTIGELAAGLGHEINQPLGAIANYAEGCVRRLRAAAADPDLIAVLDEISAQALRAGSVVRRLGEFVRKQPARRETVQLDGLVHTAAHLIEREARADNVTIELSLSPGIEVRVDPVQIEQVVLNVLLNGLEAMRGLTRPHARLSVRSSVVEPATAQMEITDNGPGVFNGTMARIFEPFFTTKPNGLGMGLAISRSIIEAHGGSLQAGDATDGGATFVVRLPLAP